MTMHNQDVVQVQQIIFLANIEGSGDIVRVFNATFNNISVISRRSVLLLDETGVPGANHRSADSN